MGGGLRVDGQIILYFLDVLRFSFFNFKVTSVLSKKKRRAANIIVNTKAVVHVEHDTENKVGVIVAQW